MSVLVAVIGGGPAGATCAYHLARAGVEVLLFERDILWEKPCGGGLTPRVFRAEPDLLRLKLPWREVFEFNLVGPAGRRVRFDLPEPIRIIARGDLDSALRRRAVSAGARFVAEKVRHLTRRPGGGWQVNRHCVDVAVGAGGINDPLARTLRLGWQPAQRALTFGCVIPGRFDSQITCRFWAGLKGYLWWFPRNDSASLGVEFMAGRANWPRARALLERFAAQDISVNAKIDGGRRFAWAEPMPGPRMLLQRPCCGRDWALIGDSAGLVDALTGEGLPYAIHSGKMAAEAIAQGQTQQYGQTLRSAILAELAATRRLAGLYYHRLLIDWHLAVIAGNRGQKQLARDYLLGYKPYRRYWRELLRRLPAMGR